jgi:branched-chain amino acid transport system ATP-binding protein
MQHAPPCLALEHVSRHFGGLKAVDEVNLMMQAGERHAVIGPNGAGKTTLFNLISGEVPVTSGTIKLFGIDITRLKPHLRAGRGIARTFQITKLFPELTVIENLLLALGAQDARKFAMFRPLSSYGDLLDRASQLLNDFGLSPLAGELARQISYGDQRKLEVALSMAGSPRLLLLDEPMAGLSPAERDSMQALLGKLDPTIAVLLIEHDIDMAFAFAPTVTVLHQGKVLAQGHKDDISANKAVQESYLGVPAD